MHPRLNSFLINSIVLGALLLSGIVQAEDHPPSKISGSSIELFERNHAFSGQILDTPVFGAFEHNPFGAKVEFRKGEKTLALNIVENGSIYSGTISEIDSASGMPTVSTSIEFVKVEKTGATDGRITLKIDGTEIFVSVKGQNFENGHFQSPRFETEWAGKPLHFNFTGEACFGYSTNLSMMILGAYVHLLK